MTSDTNKSTSKGRKVKSGDVKFEYLVHNISITDFSTAELEKNLNILGSMGWELTNLSFTNTYAVIVLMREKK